MNPTMNPAMYPPGPSVSSGEAGGLLKTGQLLSYYYEDHIALSQSPAGAGNLSLEASYNLGYQWYVSVTSANDNSGITLTITGELDGVAQEETITGPAAGTTVRTTKKFDGDSITQIAVSGAGTNIKAGWALDDGAMQLGLARDFELMIAGQYAGTTNIVINSKTCALSNNCTKDKVNNFMWSMVPQSDIGPAANGLLFWDQYTKTGETCTFDAVGKTITADAGTPFDVNALCIGRIFPTTSVNNPGPFTVTNITTSVITVSEAVVNEASVSIDIATTDDLIWNFQDQANANSLGGHSDWYVPNVLQLYSIATFGNINPCVDAAVFPSTPQTSHWASTAHYTYNRASLVKFTYATVSPNIKATFKYHCRLVRDL